MCFVNYYNRLFQHGSPAIPYQDEIQADSLFYNNTDQCKTSVSLYHPQNRNISSPLPGKWYVTAFLPYIDKVEKIKEKVLINAWSLNNNAPRPLCCV
jgi:hypothetical protein